MKCVILLLSIFFLVACSAKHNNSSTQNIDPDNMRTGLGDMVLVTFDSDIFPLFLNKCSSCHNENSNLTNVLNYQLAVEKSEEIFREVVEKKSMPIGGSMSDDERMLITQWINDGLLKMQVADVPDQPNDSNPDKVKISFSEDVFPIFQQKCSSCHNENSGLVNVSDYKTAFSIADKIFEAVVTTQRMPIGDSMTEEQRQIVSDWFDDGLLE